MNNPSDPSAYVPAWRILRYHTPEELGWTHKRLVSILKKNSQIKRWRPRKNRLSVHLADWHNYVNTSQYQAEDGDFDISEDEIAKRAQAFRPLKERGK